MKIGRRSFLSFVIGGAAGSAFTPLPWKLIDDSSIWSQNWPWTPVPSDGEYSQKNTVCTLCPGGCGITVRKVDDRAVKIEGMKGHPVNAGGICLLGLSGLQLLYGPTRVKSPLKRVGERGEGKWEKISWDEAISEVAKNLAEIRSQGESHAVGAIVNSDKGTVSNLFKRFLTAYGSPNFMTTPSIQDSYRMTISLMQEVINAQAGFDVENADFILSFGSGIIDGWGSPVRMFKANSAWKADGKKVVQIESRLSNTAAKSDKWIPINPGTEAALALGLANVIITNSLDSKKISQSTGFESFKKLVQNEYSTDKVSKITGINSTAIVSLAKNFAQASKPLAICGKGQGSAPGSLDEFMAVHALNALVGNINEEGGVWAVSEPDYIKWSDPELDSVASTGVQKERIDGAGSEYLHATSLLNRFPEVINSGEGYPFKALFVSDANPLYSMPDSKAIKAAFKSIPFVVSFSSYMDETASNADLILPNHVYLERYEDVPTLAGLSKPIVGLARPVVKPQFNTKHVGDVIMLMAKALGGKIADAFPWDNYEACLKETLGIKWDALVENGFEFNGDKCMLEGDFNFYPEAMKSLSDFSPVSIEGSALSYPLILMPYDSIRLANGYIGDPPFAIKAVEDTVLKGKDACVEVNPKTGKELGLTQGRHAFLYTPRGKAKVKVHLYEGIMPGIVALPRGLGHTAYDKYLAGKGCNFNELIGSVEDQVSGLDAAWGIRARLTKV